MGIRETLNEHQGVTIGAAIGVTLLAIGFVVYSMNAGGASSQLIHPPPQTWFTVDDGKTFFADDASKFPPFDEDGKTALGCAVYEVNGNRVVGHVFRYTEAGKKRMEEAMRGPLTSEVSLVRDQAVELKKPLTGDSGWVKGTDPRGAEIRKPPAGANVQEIFP